ncbi:MAG TPA: molybdopterin-dependent oxidoreductase, partial [Tenuifilaceae bacterium]|nr:molybdopterin-dependent oxidoreductase [Tenuifilaceae bacterium]
TFGINIEKVIIHSTNTSRVANTSPTAASSGADLNGNALLVAANALLKRLKEVAAEITDSKPEQIEFVNNNVLLNGESTGISWEKLIMTAYLKRVCLSENGHYATPTIHFDKIKEKGHPFAYHVYGTAAIAVTVDCIRGTYEIDDVLIVHDFGNSINPTIDLGQVEGAVVQGIGWATLEELAYNEKGKLLSNSLSTYKVPDIYFAPKTLKCEALNTKGPELAVFKSKAVGEPPFMYGIAAYFAIQNAIKSFNPNYKPDFNLPMTPEKVLMRLYGN